MSHGDDYKPHCGDFVVPGTLAGLLAYLAVGTCLALVTEVGMEAGSVADWVAAVATALALGAAVVAARAAFRAVRVELNRDDRSQAELVAAWPSSLTTIETPPSQKTTAITGVFLALRNASQLPVFDVRVDVTFTDSAGVARDAVPPPALTTIMLDPNETPKLHPVGMGGQRGYIPMKDFAVTDADKVPGELKIELLFTDMSGIRWRRTRNGRPTIVSRES